MKRRNVFNIYSKGGRCLRRFLGLAKRAKLERSATLEMTRKERRQRRRAYALLHDIILKVTKA